MGAGLLCAIVPCGESSPRGGERLPLIVELLASPGGLFSREDDFISRTREV